MILFGDLAAQGRTSRGEWGGFIPPNIFREKDDNSFITPNIGKNCYAIAIKHLMPSDGGQGCKCMLSIEEMI